MTKLIKRSNRFIIYTLLVIILIGAFFRIANSLENLPFWGDSLRDIIATQKIWNSITSFKLDQLPTKGPELPNGPNIKTYNVNAHHGAFYFYIISIPAILGDFHPYSTALFVIFLNIICIWLIYICTKKIFDIPTALLASFLLAISSFAILYGRFPWNPNLIVFFILLCVISYTNITESKEKYWPLLTFSLSAITQMHLLGYTFAIVTFTPIFVYMLYSKVKLPRGKFLILAVIAFLIPLIPEIIDLKLYGLSLYEELFHYPTTYGQYSLYNFELLYSSIQSILGFKSNTLIISLLLLFVLSVILLRLRLHESIINNKYKYSLFVNWFVSFLVIMVISKDHLIYGINHPLLFGLPLILMIFAAIIRYSFKIKILIPFAIVLLSLFVYFNLSSDIEIIRSPDKALPPPTILFKDLLRINNYIAKEDETYELYITDPLVVFPTVWFIEKYSSLQPTNINGQKNILMPMNSPYSPISAQTANIKYIIKSKRSFTNQKIDYACVNIKDTYSLYFMSVSYDKTCFTSVRLNLARNFRPIIKTLHKEMEG